MLIRYQCNVGFIKGEDMSVKRITKFPEKVLLNKTKPISNVDDDLKILIKDMFETMYLSNGVGLAANQIGLTKRVAVMNPTGEKKDELVLINPQIIKKIGNISMEEGCLSVPGLNAEVKRASEVEVEYMDLSGKQIRTNFKGLSAIIVQHEIDHLDGLLFINRLGFLKRTSLLKKINKRKKA